MELIEMIFYEVEDKFVVLDCLEMFLVEDFIQFVRKYNIFVGVLKGLFNVFWYG